MDQSPLPASVRNLERIDPKFLDPNADFVIMPLDVELDIDDARQALDGLMWLFEGCFSPNPSGSGSVLRDVPPEGMSALMRILSRMLKPACNNPSLAAMRKVRPDLFNHVNEGV